MSLETIRPYFQEAMLTVDRTYVEWEDAFNVENIPNSELDRAWHIQLSPATLASFNQACLSYNVPLVLTAWEKGYKTPSEAVDNGLKKLEAILKECVRHSRRLSKPYIKNVVPTGFSVDAISATNDNIAKLVISFTLSLHVDVET